MKFGKLFSHHSVFGGECQVSHHLELELDKHTKGEIGALEKQDISC
jgi:hypothetical protein